ncbi:unnamed protein product [Rhizopus stolonifer]
MVHSRFHKRHRLLVAPFVVLAAASVVVLVAEPVVDPVAVDPVAVDPVAVDPVAVDPVAVDPVAVDPVAVDPVVVDPVVVLAEQMMWIS